jgi:hypothetical protein
MCPIIVAAEVNEAQTQSTVHLLTFGKKFVALKLHTLGNHAQSRNDSADRSIVKYCISFPELQVSTNLFRACFVMN